MAAHSIDDRNKANVAMRAQQIGMLWNGIREESNKEIASKVFRGAGQDDDSPEEAKSRSGEQHAACVDAEANADRPGERDEVEWLEEKVED